MATQPTITTTVFGKTYAGRPYGFALELLRLEEAGQRAKAAAMFDAHNRINMMFGGVPIDLARDFSTLPMESGSG